MKLENISKNTLEKILEAMDNPKHLSVVRKIVESANTEQEIIDKFRKLKLIEKDYIYLFIYKCPFPYKKQQLLKEREEYIKTVNELEQKDSYLVWRLLEKAVKRIYKKELNDCNPHRLESGKWVCDGFHFSLSHSNGAFAVALSNKNIGVDIQLEREPRSNFEDRLSKNEIKLMGKPNVPVFYEIWTKKEALYKWLDNKKPFNKNTWKEYDTCSYEEKFKTFWFNTPGFYGDDYFYVSLCSGIIGTNVKVFDNIGISEDVMKQMHLSYNLENYMFKLAKLFQERHFDETETNMLLIGTPQEHQTMIEILENNPKMTEDEFIQKMKDLGLYSHK